MGHVTFVHGIANKPDPESLLAQWRADLFDDDGIDLDEWGVTSSMVYWADMLYEAPLPPGSTHESTADELSAAVADADLQWLMDVPVEEAMFVATFAREVGLEALTPASGSAADQIVDDSVLEAVPLPGPLKRRLMRVLLRDVHHFLYDATFEPRPGETFQIRRDIRARMLNALQDSAQRPGPHILIGHSLGSVIAYDALTAIEGVPRVDALLTLGSPLGISEIQNRLKPRWSREDGWPAARLAGPWWNVYDGLDPVCGGLDRRIAGDYRHRGRLRVLDIPVENEGSWRHSSGKYLRQDRLRDRLREVFA